MGAVSNLHFQGKRFSATVIQVCAPNTNTKEVEWFYEDLQDLIELTPPEKKKKKNVLFITGDWNTEVGRQKIPGVTGKFGLGVQNEAGQRLTKFFSESTLIVANTFFQQHKRQLYTWTSPDGEYQNQIDYILCRQRETLYSQQKQTGS